jgi:hypothetical protein
MRSADGLTKMATAFMGEPTKQYNMMMQAAYDARKTTGSARKPAVKRLVRTATVLAISGVANAMAQSIIDAIRDDDKEKKYWEKWLSAFAGAGDDATFWKSNLFNAINPAAYIHYVKDILSLMQGFDVSRMDMESIEKLISAGQHMMKALSGTGKLTIGAAATNLVVEIARSVGLPVSIIKREIKSFAMTVAIESDNYLMQYRMERASLDLNYSGNGKTFMDILYNAYVNDKEAYAIIYADMVKDGYDKDKLASAMEDRMKKAQGVKKVTELESRFLHPDQQVEYDQKMADIQKSRTWRKASEEQRDSLEADLYEIVTDSKSGLDLQEKIEAGKDYGLSETDYLLYRLALEMYDTPNKNGKLGGTPTNEEKADAILSLDGLSDSAMAYLWDTKQGYEAFAEGVDMDSYISYVGDDGKVNVEKLAGGSDYGIDADMYFDFLDALKAVDQPSKNGNYGSFTQDEATAAISSIPGLTREQRAYLWQSVNSGWNEKSNPWR